MISLSGCLAWCYQPQRNPKNWYSSQTGRDWTSWQSSIFAADFSDGRQQFLVGDLPRVSPMLGDFFFLHLRHEHLRRYTQCKQIWQIQSTLPKRSLRKKNLQTPNHKSISNLHVQGAKFLSKINQSQPFCRSRTRKKSVSPRRGTTSPVSGAPRASSAGGITCFQWRSCVDSARIRRISVYKYNTTKGYKGSFCYCIKIILSLIEYLSTEAMIIFCPLWDFSCNSCLRRSFLPLRCNTFLY